VLGVQEGVACDAAGMVGDVRGWYNTRDFGAGRGKSNCIDVFNS